MAGKSFFIKEKGCKVDGSDAHWLHTVHCSRLGQTCVRTLPYAYAVVNSTTRNWAHLTSKQWPPNWSPQKMGELVIMVESRRIFVLFLILGRRADHPMIFHIFPYLFYHRFLVSNCSKFCVKQMGSTVYVPVSRSSGRVDPDIARFEAGHGNGKWRKNSFATQKCSTCNVHSQLIRTRTLGHFWKVCSQKRLFPFESVCAGWSANSSRSCMSASARLWSLCANSQRVRSIVPQLVAQQLSKYQENCSVRNLSLSVKYLSVHTALEMSSRKASHAGSWYESRGELCSMFEEFCQSSRQACANSMQVCFVCRWYPGEATFWVAREGPTDGITCKSDHCSVSYPFVWESLTPFPHHSSPL